MEIIHPPSATHGLGRINYYRRENRCRNTSSSDERTGSKRARHHLLRVFLHLHTLKSKTPVPECKRRDRQTL